MEGLLERTRIEKAAIDAGFDISPISDEKGWLVFRSTNFTNYLGVGQDSKNSYSVAFSDKAWGVKVGADVALKLTEGHDSWPAQIVGIVSYDDLHKLLDRAGCIGRVVSDDSLALFKTSVTGLPTTTDVERLVVQRIGQNIFRGTLIEYWQGRCAVTGLDVLPLLRASHIKPWAKCSSDEDRLDVFNGLLLAPQLDALFDGGWATFNDDGALLLSTHLKASHRKQLGIEQVFRLVPLTDRHRSFLAHHREEIFKS